MKKAKKKTLIIIPIKWGTHRKRLFLQINDDTSGRETLRNALKQIDQTGNQCKDWLEFLSKSKEILVSNGCEITHH